MTESTESRQEYEELFAQRFSSEDREYQQYLNRPADPPPIVEDWRGRAGGSQRGRDNRYQDRHGHRGRGWRGGRGWGGDRGWRGDYREQQHWHDRDRDRHSGHGSGYQSGPPSSNQGYNSHYQRPHYDRY
ncbi:RNA guanine-N7 methyltransferase activating subunit-like [Xiphias gladius]|uniref:RNA guanine-N7 methyltransferase activating subunit-like n=1 Tax=Xiphias gladius TaxID=8245 RepID=UPI001A98EB74|nr:RNA guanine-N7 methyltransferase activating subunit-like [Xiphias gladius]XP_039983048.1 RNA guanine-N7 methyltransferase activating subunit-like [Xiphias gladius]XP_039983055.1 RNA guanine-N7 methyltransferase activating subunit-like [Xiphias gladius]